VAAYGSALRARPDYAEASAAMTRLGGNAEAAAAPQRLDGGQTMR
jgi:hypothetical protein